MGEPSGDALGADLVRALKQQFPTVTIEGVVGPKLQQEGCKSLFPMETLSVMGFWEPLKRLPQLISLHNNLKNHFLQNPPDVFIGIDAPDFNLRLEKKLHAKHIPTVHYVSPSVWAWRQGRVHGIRKSVNLMLTLFPFEADFYKKHQVPVAFTGHPFADQIDLKITDEKIRLAKQDLNLDAPYAPYASYSSKTLMAILPGSRDLEMKYLAPVFIETARFCFQQNPNLFFIIPLVSKKHQDRIESLIQQLAPEIPYRTVIGKTREAITAAKVVLVTSGTATLEVMLHKKPMVVAYRMHPFTYQLMKRLVKVPYIALPNLIAQENLVPEFIQHQADPVTMGSQLLKYLESDLEISRFEKRFLELHEQLRCNASEAAVKAILNTLEIKFPR